MSDAPSPDVDADYLTYLDALVAAERTDLMVIGTADVAALIDRIRTLRRELAAADTSIATLSAGDRYGDGWEAGRDAVVALTRTMQQGFQSRMHEQATFAAIDGALQVLIANTEDLEPSND